MRDVTLSRVLLLVAVIIFVLAAFGVTVGRFDVTEELGLGLAFFAAAGLV
jgi:hypothetical protein